MKKREKKWKAKGMSSSACDENLGLDADGSSADDTLYNNLNNDNDRISGNPDGEDDSHDTTEPAGHSPIADK
ncbi:hypothetical protein [Pedobacter africanus]|uniref:Uncharacterized protein n=1 Tax=Pedobacter africanus TaxID=151894 RepID=A0A1W2DE55_9SPHI|nr:hypothetical protein [Pedobacter africanus]SMC95829.1 hypothetical protein SAMN04488524_3712 [Pedobacter africanus]